MAMSNAFCFHSQHWDKESNLKSAVSDLHGLLPSASAKALIRTRPKLNWHCCIQEIFQSCTWLASVLAKWEHKCLSSTWEGMENSIPSHLSLPENNFMLVIGSICKTLLTVYDFGRERGTGIKIIERDTEVHSHFILFLSCILFLFCTEKKKNSYIIKLHCQF